MSRHLPVGHHTAAGVPRCHCLRDARCISQVGVRVEGVLPPPPKAWHRAGVSLGAVGAFQKHLENHR
jgi:hypothetical protein